MLRSEGKVNVPLPGGDPDAFIVLLNVIHGRTREIPKKKNLPSYTDRTSDLSR
jgi:hypothetical protein